MDLAGATDLTAGHVPASHPPRDVDGGRAPAKPGAGHPALSVLGERSWQALGVIALVLAVLWVLSTVSLVVTACLIALFFSAILRPANDRLVAGGLSRSAAALTTILGWVAIMSAVLTLVGMSVAGQAPDLLDAMRQGLARARSQFPALPLPEGGNLDRILAQAQESVTAGLTTTMRTLAELGTASVLTVVLAFFILRDGSAMWNWFLEVWPHDRRHGVDEMGRCAWGTVDEYVRGLLIVAVADGVLSGIALMVLGVPLALPLAVLSFLAAFIPAVGALVVGGLAILIAFADGGVPLAIAVAVLYTVIQQLDSSVLHPWIMGRRLPLHPAAVVLALTLGGLLAGMAGALLAVPLVASMVAASRRFHDLSVRDRLVANP